MSKQCDTISIGQEPVDEGKEFLYLSGIIITIFISKEDPTWQLMAAIKVNIWELLIGK